MVRSNPHMIRANPLLATFKTLSLIWSIVLGLFLTLFIFIVVTTLIVHPSFAQFSQLLSRGSWYILLILIYSFSFVTTFLQYRYWKRIEQRRMAAAGRDPSTLATEQPAANPMALQLPFTIKLRASKGGILLFIGMALGLCLLIAADLSWLSDTYLFISTNRFYVFLVIFASLAIIVVILALAIYLSPSATQKIEVTEQGVSTRYGNQKGTVRWEEARLFAMYNGWGARKNNAIISYELSSATGIARWNRLVRQGPFRMHIEPAMSFDEYSRQMQGLNELIVARTGQPLCDLCTEHASATRNDLNLGPVREST